MPQKKKTPIERVPLNQRYTANEHSWRSYHEYMREQTKTAEGHKNAFVPSPSEIFERIKLMRTIEKLDITEAQLDSILINDCPPPHLVFRLIELYGKKEAAKRIQHFLS